MDSYRLHKGKLRLTNLHNPPHELTHASSTIFHYKKNHTTQKYWKDIEKTYIGQNFSEIEIIWAVKRKQEAALINPTGATYPSGCIYDFNWHKHCSETLRYPSE